MSDASLNFLPWVREGLASAIPTVDDPTRPQPPVARVTPGLVLNGAEVLGIAVTLRGPGDVIGVDPNQILRTDPRAGTSDFEPNCFPAIEFDRPDLPWLFTPTAAAGDRLRPWLCLIVVRKQPGVTLGAPSRTGLPCLTIAAPAVPAAELPDLAESWAWAHAQVADADVDRGLRGAPEATLSRLVCPRLLEADTGYLACLVPAFEVGRRAGLGEPISEIDAASWTLAPAWSLGDAEREVRLPVYYAWEFRTGRRGDFESLARRITAAAPVGVGTRSIDVSRPGFDAGGATTLQLEGALAPAAPTPSTADALPSAFRANLAARINVPSDPSSGVPSADPVLTAPMYGRWHAARSAVDPGGATWLDQLNVDPRWRVAAALGTRVVQRHQEALMAAAWEQAAELQQANQQRRQLQLSMAVGEVLHRRHFSALSEEQTLRIAAPAFGRLEDAAGTATILASQMRSMLPVAANRPATRRIGRLRGPLTRRVAAQNFVRSMEMTWVARLNEMGEAAPPPSPPPAPAFAALPPASEYAQVLEATASGTQPRSYTGTFLVAPEGAPLFDEGSVAPSQRVEAPDFFRSAARAHLQRVFPRRATTIEPHALVPLAPVRDTVLDRTDPRATVASMAGALVAMGDRVLAPTAAGVEPTGVETIMAAPHFVHPMYEPLRELSQELLIPGLEKIGADTALALRTNRRFVEAYMVGLNHEMARELLWRGFPTDQRGTYFDRFWGIAAPDGTARDIAPLDGWSVPDPATGRLRALGDAFGSPPAAEQFVLVIRSALLARYPNAVIYLTPAVPDADDPSRLVPDARPESEHAPIFSGSVHPDVAFFGFAVSTSAAIGGSGGDGGPGHYVVVQEHPTEPRFGVSEGLSLTGTHLRATGAPPEGLDLVGGRWDSNAAEVARITRRLAVRLAIHASRLVMPA